MNVSNVSASNKTLLPESGVKAPEEGSESKGFFETLAGIFTGSQKGQAKAVKLTDEVINVGENTDVSALLDSESEGGNQEAAAFDGEMDHDAIQSLETGQSPKAGQSEKNAVTDAEQEVTLTMDEGQQLLGRIEQANQTLNAHKSEVVSGKSLPPESGEWQSGSIQGVHSATMLNETGLKETELKEINSAALSPDLTVRISVEELEAIDTKLAQGKPLTEQETEIIEGLKTGTVIVELAEEELAQLVALPSDVKLAVSEAQTAQSNTARQAVTTGAATHAAQEMKHAAVQVPPQSADKAVMPSGTEGLPAAGINPALQQMAVNSEVNNQGMNAALAGALKATAESQDKGELQHGLAGQLQAAAGQQGVSSPQQARAEAAQQAQLPLQLTKELANEQVAEKVQMMMSKNLKNLDIRLDPPELGRMQIRMTMNSDLASVQFTVTNPQARDIIEQTLPRLREMFAQQGIQLADSSVQQQSHGGQQDRYAAAEQNRQGSDGVGFAGQSDEGFDGGVEMNVNVTSSRDGISYYA